MLVTGLFFLGLSPILQVGLQPSVATPQSHLVYELWVEDVKSHLRGETPVREDTSLVRSLTEDVIKSPISYEDLCNLPLEHKNTFTFSYVGQGSTLLHYQAHTYPLSVHQVNKLVREIVPV